jgi:unsaturated chondroitin disaccharide hydrolase
MPLPTVSGRAEGVPGAALDRCLRHVDLALAEYPPGAFPYVSRGLRYRPVLTGGVPWTAGFWPGQLWLAFTRTGEGRYRDAARALRRRLGEHLRDHPRQLDHDLGFQYLLSAAVEHELTGDGGARALAVAAADLLAARFNPAGRFIRAHGWDDSPGTATPHADGNDGPPGRFIVDCLMNLPLLYWAGRVSGSARHLEVAEAHARTSLRRLLRADGWVYHAFDCDPVSGRPVGGATIQGKSADSAWSRGQAWALYGFALAATHLGDPEYLAAARRLATHFLAACGDNLVAPWDFDATGKERTPDSSASAIAAAGLFALADADAPTPSPTPNPPHLSNPTSTPAPSHTDTPNSDPTGGDRWRGAALAILAALEERCATDARAGQEGLLSHGCYHYPAQRGIAESTAWGDFFYLEALTRTAGGTGLYALT